LPSANKQLHVQIQADETSTYTTQFIGTRVGYDQTSEPRVDANGKPLRTTRKYSSDVGQVFATVTGNTAVYQLKGDELYVRAVITSTKPHANPSFKDQREQAWTQPFGWQERLGQESKRVSAK
jgi:hypothetical protein